jgi:hypothetical protein
VFSTSFAQDSIFAPVGQETFVVPIWVTKVCFQKTGTSVVLTGGFNKEK